MGKRKTLITLENRFRKKIQKDKNIQNAYLLIHSEEQVLLLKCK